MKSILAASPIAWLRRVAVAVVAFVAFIGIAFTASELFAAGPNGAAQLGLESIAYAWPTVLALALVIGEPFLSSGLRWRHRSALVAVVAWLGSTFVYAAGLPNASLRDTGGMLIVAGSPILAVYTWRLILARTSMRGGLQLGATIVVALILSWFTVPMALVIGCAVAGACP